MSWAGKAAAGFIGTLVGGPLTGLLSAGIAHSLDREVDGYARAFQRQESAAWREYWQETLFSAEFLLAGHLARTSRLTSEASDAAFQALCGRRALSRSDSARAHTLFQDGLRAQFPVTEYVNQVRRVIHRRKDLAIDLFDALLYFNRFSATPSDAQRQALLKIARQFDLTQADLASMEKGDHRYQQRTGSGSAPSMDLAEACATLGVSADADEPAVRQAYRRQMSRHHPDKLMHKHPSSQRLAEAGARTDHIRKAYDMIRGKRGW